MLAAVLLWIGTTAALPFHPGGTDDQGCRSGSEPYRCHNQTTPAGPADATAAATDTTPTTVPTPPVVEAPRAGAPDATAPPEPNRPSEPEAPAAPGTPAASTEGKAPTTPNAPSAEVQGTQETRQPTDALARTGITESTYYLAIGLLLTGILLVTTSGVVDHAPQHLRGGFTYRRTNGASGVPMVVRVTSARQS